MRLIRTALRANAEAFYALGVCTVVLVGLAFGAKHRAWLGGLALPLVQVLATLHFQEPATILSFLGPITARRRLCICLLFTCAAGGLLSLLAFLVGLWERPLVPLALLRHVVNGYLFGTAASLAWGAFLPASESMGRFERFLALLILLGCSVALGIWISFEANGAAWQVLTIVAAGALFVFLGVHARTEFRGTKVALAVWWVAVGIEQRRVPSPIDPRPIRPIPIPRGIPPLIMLCFQQLRDSGAGWRFQAGIPLLFSLTWTGRPNSMYWIAFLFAFTSRPVGIKGFGWAPFPRWKASLSYIAAAFLLWAMCLMMKQIGLLLTREVHVPSGWPVIESLFFLDLFALELMAMNAGSPAIAFMIGFPLCLLLGINSYEVFKHQELDFTNFIHDHFWLTIPMTIFPLLMIPLTYRSFQPPIVDDTLD